MPRQNMWHSLFSMAPVQGLTNIIITTLQNYFSSKTNTVCNSTTQCKESQCHGNYSSILFYCNRMKLKKNNENLVSFRKLLSCSCMTDNAPTTTMNSWYTCRPHTILQGRLNKWTSKNILASSTEIRRKCFWFHLHICFIRMFPHSSE